MHLLQTSRLYLRRFTETDVSLILQLNSDYDVVKYLHEPILDTAEKARKILMDVILPQYKINLGRWAVFTRQQDEFIGWCGLKSRPELNEIDLGYRFKKNYWGNGFATEAAKATLQYGFETLQLNEIMGRAHIDNIASIKVLEKIGMQYIRDEIVDDCPVKTFVAVKGVI